MRRRDVNTDKYVFFAWRRLEEMGAEKRAPVGDSGQKKCGSSSLLPPKHVNGLVGCFYIGSPRLVRKLTLRPAASLPHLHLYHIRPPPRQMACKKKPSHSHHGHDRKKRKDEKAPLKTLKSRFANDRA